ncbi:hypothetical protein QBC45DRAFT_42004 [Copromyces sp. CBS 386.78]|nr:hypothetical protein QBC45DRAFT_42004 [Copromyces sp. CBS 386.78]
MSCSAKSRMAGPGMAWTWLRGFGILGNLGISVLSLTLLWGVDLGLFWLVSIWTGLLHYWLPISCRLTSRRQLGLPVLPRWYRKPVQRLLLSLRYSERHHRYSGRNLHNRTKKPACIEVGIGEISSMKHARTTWNHVNL